MQTTIICLLANHGPVGRAVNQAVQHVPGSLWVVLTTYGSQQLVASSDPGQVSQSDGASDVPTPVSACHPVTEAQPCSTVPQDGLWRWGSRRMWPWQDRLPELCHYVHPNAAFSCESFIMYLMTRTQRVIWLCQSGGHSFSLELTDYDKKVLETEFVKYTGNGGEREREFMYLY